MALYAAKVFVKGRVQGVSFRAFARKNAKLLGLNGYVKNLSDGRVEAFVEGDKDLIEAFFEALRLGPEGAQVRNVDIEWSRHTGAFTDFKIVY